MSITTLSTSTSGATNQSHTSVGNVNVWSTASVYFIGITQHRASGSAAAPTVVGSSLWTSVAFQAVTAAPAYGVSMFWTVGDGSTSTVTIDFGGVAHDGSSHWIVVAEGSLSSQAQIQSANSTAGSNSVATHTGLSSLSSSNNVVVVAWGRNANDAITAGSGYTLTGQRGVASPAQRIGIAYGGTASPDATFASSAAFASVAAEWGIVADAPATVVGQSTLQRSALRRRRR